MERQDIRLRLARAEDAAPIAAIYNHEVLHTTATFDTEPTTVEQQRLWLSRHAPARHPVVVAEQDDDLLGWAALSRWSDRCAYARAAETSVYVHREQRGRGVGRALLEELIARARRAELGVLLARVCSEGAASLRLHRACGFSSIGTMRRVGEKFGRLLDVILLELQLDR